MRIPSAMVIPRADLRRTPIALALTGILTILPAITGCDINEPALPAFSTSVTIPIGEERIDVLDVIEDEDYLTILEDGSLSFSTTGEQDTLSIDFDFSVAIEGQNVENEIGSFSIDVADPANFTFPLSDIYADAEILDGSSVPVPAFDFNLASDPTTLSGFSSATISSGELAVTIGNGLPVPLELLQVTIVDATTDLGVVTAVFPSVVSTGATTTVIVPLDGVDFPGTLKVGLSGGSAGSLGTPVLIDAGAEISVSAELRDLEVSSATAEVGAQHFSTAFVTALPGDYGVIRAEILSGTLPWTMTNELAIPCLAQITWNEIVDTFGSALTLTVDLPAGSSTSASLGLAGCSIVGDGVAEISELTISVDVTSPGSSGEVTISATDALQAVIGSADLVFGTVTGSFPEQTFVFDELSSEIDLPDEIDGISLTRASLILTIENELGIPADVSFDLSGINEHGETNTMAVVGLIEASLDRGDSKKTIIVFDEDNSGIIAFINNLPTSIVMSGQVTAGGAGVIGTVAPGDKAILNWEIIAPLEFVIDGTTIDGSPELLDFDEELREMIADHTLGAGVSTEITNHMPFAVEIRILASTDTLTISESPLLVIGPLAVDAGVIDPATCTVTEASVSHPVIELSAADALIFATPDLYAQVEVTLPGTDGQPVRLLSTDWLTVCGTIRLDMNVHDD